MLFQRQSRLASVSVQDCRFGVKIGPTGLG